MSIGEYCNRDVVFVSPEDAIPEAILLMRDQHVGALVVTEERAGGRIPVGILTDRDIVIEILAANIAIDSVKVGDVMSQPLQTAREDEEVSDIIKRMRAYGVRRMPVVDANGVLLGLITFDDLLELEAERLADIAALVHREQQQERGHRP